MDDEVAWFFYVSRGLEALVHTRCFFEELPQVQGVQGCECVCACVLCVVSGSPGFRTGGAEAPGIPSVPGKSESGGQGRRGD